jgi:hypothetical protein
LQCETYKNNTMKRLVYFIPLVTMVVAFMCMNANNALKFPTPVKQG